MRRREAEMARRRAFAVLLLVTGFAACNGWPKAAELDQARTKPEKFPTYAKTPASQQSFTFENRTWIVQPASVELHAAKLQSVGSAGGVTLYAPEGAQTPYRVLYAANATKGGTMYNTVVPID